MARSEENGNVIDLMDTPSPPPTSSKRPNSSPNGPKVGVENVLIGSGPNSASNKKPKLGGDASNVKVVSKVGESPLCHQHRAICASDKLKCTFIKKDGQRCPLQYCHLSLKKVYNQDANAILQAGRNRLGVDRSLHCPPEQAKYLWQCPRCSGQCHCSLCRKRVGLPALGPQPSDKPKPPKPVSGPSKAPKAKKQTQLSAAIPAAGPSSVDKKSLPPRNSSPALHTPPLRDELATPSPRRATSGAVSDGLRTPSPPLKPVSVVKAPVKQLNLPRPLKKPKVPKSGPPLLSRIHTRLFTPNIEERIWIYETLVRFDLVRVPKAVLSRLDRFDAWLESDVHIILEAIAAILAGLSNIRSGAPNDAMREVVTILRKQNGEVQRGECWSAARRVCVKHGVAPQELPEVSLLPAQVALSVQEASDAAAAAHSGTLLGSRSTRTRRGAELNARERMRDQSRKEVTGYVDSDEEESEGEVVTRKSLRGRTGRSLRTASVAMASEEESTSALEDSSDDVVPTRRSGRLGKAPPQRSTRSSRAALSADPSDASETGSEAEGPQWIRRSGRNAARSHQMDKSGSRGTSASNRLTTDAEPTRSTALEKSTPPPSFEERVAILSRLLQLLMETDEVRIELTNASAKITEHERNMREEIKGMEETFESKSREILQRAPSMTNEVEFTKWKTERKAQEVEHKLEILDARVVNTIAIDACKLRSGPLGIDTDGNVYWHLTEFVDKMPKDTTGRWAWCLLVHGKPCEWQDEDKAAARRDGEAVTMDSHGAALASSNGHGQTSSEQAQPPRWFGTNDHLELGRLISWLQYRAEVKVHEENVVLRNLEADQSLSGATRRERKRDVQARQILRTAELQSLVAKLTAVRQYYQWQYGDVSEPGPRTKEEFEREQATLISAQQPEVAQGMIEQNQAQTNGSTSPVVGPSFVRTTIDLKPPAVDRSRKREQSSADSLSSAADTDDQGFVVEI